MSTRPDIYTSCCARWINAYKLSVKRMRTDRVYSEVGKALELIQFTDRLFKSILLLVFPGKESSDLELFKKNEKHLDKATLGKLVNTLKSRVSLNERFENIFEGYLNDRNSLIHNWDEIANWEHEESAIAFTVGVQKQAAYLGYTFLGFMRAWMEQAEFTSVNEAFPELEELFAEIDVNWKPLINEFIEEVKNT